MPDQMKNATKVIGYRELVLFERIKISRTKVKGKRARWKVGRVRGDA